MKAKAYQWAIAPRKKYTQTDLSLEGDGSGGEAPACHHAAPLRSQASPCEICGEHSGTVPGFSPSNLDVRCQYHSTNAPDSSSYYNTFQKGKLAMLGNLHRKKCMPDIEEFRAHTYCHTDFLCRYLKIRQERTDVTVGVSDSSCTKPEQ